MDRSVVVNGIEDEAEAFRLGKQHAEQQANQRVALRLAAGLEPDDFEASTPERRVQILLKLERTIERERLKGLRRHWSYDLNRHIALKQALDEMRAHMAGTL